MFSYVKFMSSNTAGIVLCFNPKWQLCQLCKLTLQTSVTLIFTPLFPSLMQLCFQLLFNLS
jgi:hypothetical protein